MPIPLFLFTGLLTLMSVGSNNSTYSFASFPLPATAGFVTQKSNQFSSRYTSLINCGSGLTKKEEKEAEQTGTDLPSKCKGLGGYEVNISYSACAAGISLDKGGESISLGMQAGDWTQKTMEWRLANGKPFAVIFRVYEYAGDDPRATGGKITGESLIVKGLKGYEHIDGKINVRKAPNPNLKARELADKGYKNKP